MLRYRQFLSERDLWLEDWNQKCEQYIMESPGFDINAERTVALNVKNKFKPFLQKVANEEGITGFDFDSPKNNDRIGAGSTTIDDFKALIDKALGINSPIIAQSDSVEIGGTTYKNESGKYAGIPVVGHKVNFLMMYAGTDTRSGNTRIQELAFLYTLASKYYNPSSINGINKEDFNKVAHLIEEKGKAFASGDKTTNDVFEFLIGNPEWAGEWDIATDTFKKKYPDNPVKFVKDSSSFELNKQAEKLFLDDPSLDEIKWDADKWNPADVWICYQKSNTIDVEGGIKSLNHKLLDYLKKKNEGIIGLSLKKGSSYTEVKPETGGYEILDNRRSREIKDPEIENGFKLYYGKFFGQSVNQGLALIDYNKKVVSAGSRHEIVYRNFKGKAGGVLVGEVKVKGTKAAHGKVYLEYIDVESGTSKISRTVKNATSKNVVKYDSSSDRYILTKDGARIFKNIASMYRQLKRGVWENIVSDKIRSTRKEKPDSNEHDFIRQYGILERSKEEFEDFLNGDILNEPEFKKLKSTAQKASLINIKMATRFQTIAFGGWWCRIYMGNRKLALKTVIGMLHHAKSMNPRFSASHAKIT